MYLAIDIGGTNIKYANVTSDYKITKHWTVSSIPPKNCSFLDYLIQNIKYDENLQGIGLSIPGIISSDGKVLSHSSSTLHELYEKNICNDLYERYHVPTAALNDGDAAGIFECWNGYGSKYPLCVCILIGTGIGGCICSHKNVVRGNFNAAGEFHRIPYYDTEKKKWRCIGDFCRMKSLIQKYHSLSGMELSPMEIWDLYLQNESHAKQAVDTWMFHLTQLLIMITAFCSPDILCIGGGISDNTVFLSRLSACFTETSAVHFPDYKKLPEVVSCSAKSASNLLGAIVYLRQKTIRQQDILCGNSDQ